jgi:plasmid replication initiation protein
MEKKKNDIVKQSNTLARSPLGIEGIEEAEETKGKLVNRGNSPWLERILSLVMAHIKMADFDFEEFNIPISELGVTGRKLAGKEYQDIKTALTQLVTAYYSVENVSKRTYEVTPVFARLRYEPGVISVLFNSVMKPHLLQLTADFTTYEFSEFRRLGTVYAQKLYRFLKSWKNVPEVVIPLEQLHKCVGATKSLRTKFINFKARVLEPAHAEITGHTRFWYEWEPVKTKNKVTAIRFFFRGRPALETPDDSAKKAKEEHDKLQSESTACYFAHQNRGVECTPKRTKRCKYCTTRGVKYGKDSAKRQKELEAGASA